MKNHRYVGVWFFRLTIYNIYIILTLCIYSLLHTSLSFNSVVLCYEEVIKKVVSECY